MSSRIFTRLRQLYRSSSSQAKSGEGSETSQWGGHAVKFVKYVCIVHVVREYVCEFSLCVGPSMLPTFNKSGDIVLFEHLSVFAKAIQPGDVVIARSPQNVKNLIVKRVIGLEGDTVHVQGRTWLGPPQTLVVPKGHVWLEGDNPLNSTDSRQYGAVPWALLQGRAFLKVWPLTEAGMVERKLLQR